ncbi:alanine--tRNA ligase [Parcubacteria bacterium SG8_24]|nr:MAG: alanine--tRNA ligase [Parcubacteria bacterium SG8_24]
MTAAEIRQKYLDFFRERGHVVIPSASLIPENDPTVLFTTAGMHPLVPFLMGEPHPEGRRLADVQKCIRTGDIDEVGDNRHLTFFEMLGNWSFGDYFKEEAIAWSFEFLTGREWMDLSPDRLFVTVFAGDEDAPRDEESIRLWKERFASVGLDAEAGERIFPYPKKENWWGPAGQTGPCGPDTEMFYDTTGDPDRETHLPGATEPSPCHPNCDCGRYVEVWNDVFMEYFKTEDGKYEPLSQRNVDTGMGLERMAMVMQGQPTVFETDLFRPLIAAIEERSGSRYGADEGTTRAMRIIADHVKAAVFIIGDPRGVSPSNVDQGYVLRRLIRRAVRYARQSGIEGRLLSSLAGRVIDIYGEAYPELVAKRERIVQELDDEEDRFGRTLQKGLQEAKKVGTRFAESEVIPGEAAFHLYETYGFPRELTEEVLAKPVDRERFDEEFRKHQELSRAGAERKFAGGLADRSERTVRMHTATHLLHEALRRVLGQHVEQRGSNITPERLRFDFSHPQKMTEEELKAVDDLVNEQIDRDLPVSFEMMSVEQAKQAGAIGLFEEKYEELDNRLKVYTVGDAETGVFSREICGGPHVEHTGQIGRFRIKKEQASSAGVRRIKAEIG